MFICHIGTVVIQVISGVIQMLVENQALLSCVQNCELILKIQFTINMYMHTHRNTVDAKWNGHLQKIHVHVISNDKKVMIIM